MIVKIPDELAEQLRDANPDAAKLPIDTLVAKQLARFASHPITTRVVLLSPEHLLRLETLLGGAQLQTGADVIARAEAYSQVKLGTVVIPLTPAEKEELAYRAKKQGKPVGELMRELIQQLHTSLFNDTVPVR